MVAPRPWATAVDALCSRVLGTRCPPWGLGAHPGKWVPALGTSMTAHRSKGRGRRLRRWRWSRGTDGFWGDKTSRQAAVLSRAVGCLSRAWGGLCPSHWGQVALGRISVSSSWTPSKARPSQGGHFRSTPMVGGTSLHPGTHPWPLNHLPPPSSQVLGSPLPPPPSTLPHPHCSYPDPPNLPSSSPQLLGLELPR